ncbi:nucleotidyltransferase family protein [Pendulispora albinea]|uniref:Nucleotidyltransferase family protein n=1 Tax=Pendulispora albinea TaxID=2741071 RepID=A0ABZ2LQ06_9BACT
MRPDVAERAAVWSKHHHARGVLRRVLEVCSVAGIKALPVKGVLTAHRLYRDPSDRPIHDIDLRVRPRDLGPLLQAGTDAGFQVLEVSRAAHNLAFGVDGLMVEFEAHIGPRGLCDLQVETLLGRAIACEDPYGFPHLEPELHDHVLLLAINAYKDKLVEAFPWAVRDLELAGARDDFDPWRFAQLARASGVAALVWLVADWLATTRGHEGWARVRTALDDAPRARYRAMMRRALIDPGSLEGPLRRLVTRALVRAASDRASSQLTAVGVTLAWAVEGKVRALAGR